MSLQIIAYLILTYKKLRYKNNNRALIQSLRDFLDNSKL